MPSRRSLRSTPSGNRKDYDQDDFFSGQNGVFVVDLAAGTSSGPYAYTIADLDSRVVIGTTPTGDTLTTAGGLSLGVSTPFTFFVDAFDNYFTGNLTDQIGPMQYELDITQFYAGDLTM